MASQPGQEPVHRAGPSENEILARETYLSETNSRCEACGGECPPGVDLRYLKARKPDRHQRMGLYCCPDCVNKARAKKQSQQNETMIPEQFAVHPSRGPGMSLFNPNIQKQNAAAQRRGVCHWLSYNISK